MPRELTKIALAEVSLVDDPANQHAVAVLWKRNTPPAEPGGGEEAPGGGVAKATGKKDEKTMTDEEMKAAEAAKMKDEVEKAVKAATDPILKALGDAGVKLEKSGEGYKVEIAKASEPEMIEFGGEMIAKSAVPAPVLKALETQAREVAILKAEREGEQLRKRADTEVPNLTGTPDARGALLKAVDGIADEATREAARAVLKGADAAAASLLKVAGQRASGTTGAAASEVEVKVQKMRDAKPDLTYQQAYAEVVKANPELYNRVRAEAAS